MSFNKHFGSRTPKPLKLTSTKVKEQAREVQVINRLKNLGYVAFKHDSVGIWNPTVQSFQKNNHPGRMDGVSDALATVPPNGKSLVVEIKTPEKLKYVRKHYLELREYYGPSKDKLRLAKQVRFVESIIAAGGYGFFTDSVEDCDTQLVALGLITEAQRHNAWGILK